MSNQISGYLRISQVLEIIPIGRSTWWKWVAEGKAPKPIKIGPRTTVWKTEDVKKFISELNDSQSPENQSSLNLLAKAQI